MNNMLTLYMKSDKITLLYNGVILFASIREGAFL